jgi:tetraacyldisaccharide-1-P 4'-kinase
MDLAAITEQTGVAAVFQARMALGPVITGLKPCSTADGEPGAGARDGVSVPDDAPPPTRVFALAGIARPQRFFQMLASSGWLVVGQMTFPDHHWYTRADLERIAAASRRSDARMVVTTEKDLVRLLPYRPFPVPIAAAPLEFAVEPAAQFRAWLIAQLAAARAAAAMEQPA